MKNQLKILITGAGGPAVSFMIKQLRSYRDCYIIAIDMSKNSSGFFLADKSYVVPPGNSNKFECKLRDIITKNSINVVISVVDEELEVISKLSKELNFFCIQPKLSFIKNCLDKYKFSKLLNKLNLEDLNTHTLSAFIKKKLINKNNFPIILKPRFGRGSRGVKIINSIKEFNQKVKIIKDNYSLWIVQDYIKGDEYTVSVVAYSSKTNFSVVPKLIKLKEGITKIAITKKNIYINKACEKILRNTNPKGPFNLQCVFNKKNKKVYIFEINPRFSTSTSLTIASGLDEINLLINNYLGIQSNISNIQWEENVKMIRNYTDYFSNKYEFKN